MSVQLALDDVRVTLGGTEILHGVGLDVLPGEFVTLLGPSGSGKTTTLNVVAGLVPVSGGHVRFDAQSVERRAAHDRDIGMVFQSYALFPHMSVGENIAFPLLTRKVPKAERRAIAERMLALVELSGTIDRPVSSLSGGQQQRIAIARALAPNPSVLLLDEPMAALDKQLRETMQIELKRIQAEVGVTTLAVTHDQTEAMTMSDRVAIMRDGNVEQIAAPETVYREPATLFVARFLGETNFFPIAGGQVVGFGTRAPADRGTVILRPEDFALAADVSADQPRLLGTVITASFQGSRYRVDVDRGPALEPLIVTLPPNTDARELAPGLPIELALRPDSNMHVVGEEATSEPPLAQAELAVTL